MKFRGLRWRITKYKQTRLVYRACAARFFLVVRNRKRGNYVLYSFSFFPLFLSHLLVPTYKVVGTHLIRL